MGAIGGGGMGIVYRAEDRVLGRSVAIKLLPLGGATADASSVTRFQREARAAASLSHPNIVSVFDAGSDETTHFIVMEYVGGRSLAEVLSRDGRLEVNHAVDLAAQIASGLAAAHRAGIVHRDVKPANVMVDDSGTVKLLDFGIARAVSSATLTQAGSVLGSALYIAPEIALGGAAEERSDVYSLGCVLYEMVTGRPPFSGELDAAVLHQHVNARARPPRALAGGVPQALDELIMQMLSKRATERPSAGMLAPALARTLPRSTRRRAPRPANRYPGARATAPLPVLGRTRPRHRVRLGLAAVIAAVLTVIGFAVTASDSGNGRGSSQSAARAATLHSIARGGRGDGRSSRLLPAAAGAFRDAARLVAIAVASVEAARAPAPAVAPPPRHAARKPHPPRTGRTRSHAKKQVEPSPSEGVQPEAPSSEGEAEAPTSASPTENPPGTTAPAEAPAPPPSTSGPPTP